MYRLPSLSIYGKTTQRTTTGVQLIPMPYKITGTTAVGVTAEVKGDGSVKCTGSAASSAYFVLYGGYAVDATPIPDWLVEGETYTISGGTEKVGVALFLYKDDGTAWQRVGFPKTTFVMPSGYAYIGIFVYVPTGNTVNETVYPMLNAGSTAFEYEPYSGGQPSPSPDYPQELVSPGDGGSIVVSVTGENDAQSMTIATPNGLPGIPVTSGGNYTDANGQQWVCDEIDLARGVYIQRCGHYIFNGSEQWTGIVISTVNGTPYVRTPVARSKKEYDTDILCNLGKGQRWVGPQYTLFINGYESFAVGGDALRGAETLEEFKEIIAENPIELVYQLETPIETPLSEEELAAYAALHTYRNNTTVYNDASAHMELEYVMDAKKYIDSLIAGGSSTTILNATVE